METQVWHPLAHSRLRYCRSGTLRPTPPDESLKCYRLEVRKVTPRSHSSHHMVNHTLKPTFTHILGPLASFGGIPVLQGSPPSKRMYVGPRWCSPVDFSARDSTNVLFIGLGLFSPW